MLSSSNLQYKLGKYRYRQNINKKPVYQSKIEYYKEMFDLLSHHGGQLFANPVEALNQLADNFSQNSVQLNSSIYGVNQAVQENTDALREVIKMLQTVRLTFDSTKYQEEIDKVTQQLNQENNMYQSQQGGSNIIHNFDQAVRNKAKKIEQADKFKNMDAHIKNFEDVLEIFKQHQMDTTNSMKQGVEYFNNVGKILDDLVNP